MTVEYALSPAGLAVTTSATNVGAGPCPYGCGQHPYLTLGTRTVDELVLTAPGSSVLVSDERGDPTGSEPVDGTEFDFRAGRTIGSTRLDNAFTDLRRDEDGLARVRLEAAQGRRGDTLDGRELRLRDALHRRHAPRREPPEHRRRADDLPAERVPQRTALIRLEPGESVVVLVGDLAVMSGNRAPRAHPRRRLRRRRGGAEARARRRGRGARGSPRLPHLPAAPLPARHRPARDDGGRALAPRPARAPRDVGAHGGGDRGRPRRTRGALRRPRADRLRLPRLRPRGAGELLRDGGRARARVPDVHAAQRGPAEGPSPRALGDRRPRPGAGRGRRAEHRRRGRRADRRRDGGRGRRALPRGLRLRLPGHRPGPGARDPGRGRPGALPDVQAEAARVRDQGAVRPDGRGGHGHRGAVGLARPG